MTCYMILSMTISCHVYSPFLKFANDILNFCGHVAAVNPIPSYCENINAIRYFYDIRLRDTQLSGKFNIQSVYGILSVRYNRTHVTFIRDLIDLRDDSFRYPCNY